MAIVWDLELEELARRRELAKQMGAPASIARQRERGTRRQAKRCHAVQYRAVTDQN